MFKITCSLIVLTLLPACGKLKNALSDGDPNDRKIYETSYTTRPLTLKWSGNREGLMRFNLQQCDPTACLPLLFIECDPAGGKDTCSSSADATAFGWRVKWETNGSYRDFIFVAKGPVARFDDPAPETTKASTYFRIRIERSPTDFGDWFTVH